MPDRPVYLDNPTYLDNASTSWPKPPQVAAAMGDHLESGSATPARGAYAMATKSGRSLDALRNRLAQMIRAPKPEQMVLTSGATESLNMAILGLFDSPPPGAPPKVVTTQLEHNAVVRPLASLQGKGWIELVVIPADADGFVDEKAFREALDERTALVACIHASNVLGTIQPIDRIAQMVRERAPAALMLIDASQSIGLVPIDVTAVDLLAFSGHKTLLGPAGTGALYVSDRALGIADAPPIRTLNPSRFGGTGDDSQSKSMPEALPGRFEPGTPNTLGFVGLLAALNARTEQHADETLANERRLCQRLIEHLHNTPRARVLGLPEMDRRVGVVSFTVDGWDPAEFAAVLDASFGICVRAGLHCSPGAHASAGTLDGGGAVRVSPGPFTTDADMDTLLKAIDQLT